MKSSNLLLVPLLGIMALSSSCKKLMDDIHHNPAYDKFKISKISVYSDSITGFPPGAFDKIFTFNSAGEPISGIARTPFTGNSNQAFQYDSHGRLAYKISYFGDAPSSIYATSDHNNLFDVHIYTHGTSGNILADTMYISDGRPIGGPAGAAALLYSITTFQYDAYDRLIHSKEVALSSYITENTYRYGADGNLIGFTYDDKIGVHRLSKVMMFLDRDYSLNNKLHSTIDSSLAYTYLYNSSHLPIKITGPVFMPSEAGNFQSKMDVTYAPR